VEKKMHNILADFEKAQVERLKQNQKIEDFAPGDTLNVRVKIGDRFQNYEGVCVSVKNRGLNSAFTVRKLSYGEGVERVFPFYSPIIDSVTNLKRGKVRRAKLYYLKDRVGKAAKIAEATKGFKGKLSKAILKDKAAAKVTAKAALSAKVADKAAAKNADTTSSDQE
jgi:large subunit ribosomal protein L19